MIDPNNPINLNPQDLSGQQNSQVDPSFLPKDSNVYIRTMNTDLSNLKSQGGEALPYVETPSVVPNVLPVAPAMPEPIMPVASAPSEALNPVAFEMPKPEMPQPVNPVVEQPSTLDSLKQKISELSPNTGSVPIANPIATPNLEINNLSSNLNTDFNNLITPEEFSPMANVDPNDNVPKSKNKIMILVAILGLVVLVVVVIFVIRPKTASPKVNMIPGANQNILVPPTTISMAPVTKPSPFMPVKNAFQVSDISIDVSKSPEIVNQIKEEAKELLATNEFKVIVPKIKDIYLTAPEILNAFADNIPQNLMSNLLEKYLVYAFYGEVHPALGIVVQVKPESVDAVKTDFLT
jgi:hypothetical protein